MTSKGDKDENDPVKTAQSVLFLMEAALDFQKSTGTGYKGEFVNPLLAAADTFLRDYNGNPYDFTRNFESDIEELKEEFLR